VYTPFILAVEYKDIRILVIIMPHYTFIEIGTSDFETLLETSNDTDIGLSVEPLSVYLNKLPNKQNVTKVNAAISDKNGEMSIYYVPPEIILAADLPWWFKGCNSVGHPHPTVSKCLSEMGKSQDFIMCDTVPVKTMETLIFENNIESIGTLKIDTEGHDCIILNNYITYCEKNPALFAKTINFETNVLSLVDDQEAVINRLLNNGYKLVSRNVNENTVLEKI
jgi:FkbM family methyltransferase